jgi:hypothetical protein
MTNHNLAIRVCASLAIIPQTKAGGAVHNPSKERIRLANSAIDPTIARVK